MKHGLVLAGCLAWSWILVLCAPVKVDDLRTASCDQDCLSLAPEAHLPTPTLGSGSCEQQVLIALMGLTYSRQVEHYVVLNIGTVQPAL